MIPGSVSLTVLPPVTMLSNPGASAAEVAAIAAAAASLATATGRPERFTFDKVFPPDVQQAEIYDAIGSHVLQSVLAGFNGCILAYGQVRSAHCVSDLQRNVLDDFHPELL